MPKSDPIWAAFASIFIGMIGMFGIGIFLLAADRMAVADNTIALGVLALVCVFGVFIGWCFLAKSGLLIRQSHTSTTMDQSNMIMVSHNTGAE
jgi:hypothetical protein